MSATPEGLRPECQIEECTNRTKLIRGMCSIHYQRWRKYGDPLALHRSRHGHSPQSKRSSEYTSWVSMLQRCQNPNHTEYLRYGGRGITVHAPWADSFVAFLAHMGPKPTPKHTIERIDNDGNYEPGNVRWATRKEQARNKASTVMLTVGSTTLCQSEWAKRQGINADTIRYRLRRGATPEQAIAPRRSSRHDTFKSPIPPIVREVV
jgi:hypothetical protein